MIIDQSRSKRDGTKYKTRNNFVHNNELIFEGAACSGGASDADPGDENYSTITEGNNKFDGNVYRVPKSSQPPRFPWGHKVFDWEGFRATGLERQGAYVAF